MLIPCHDQPRPARGFLSHQPLVSENKENRGNGNFVYLVQPPCPGWSLLVRPQH